jgi:hypothetical protein
VSRAGARGFLCALAASFAFAAPGLAKPVVILISMDGVRHDYPDRDALPAFARIAREGARAEALLPAFPSITFPAHTTLSTGAHPDRHGIVNNLFETPDGEFRYGSGPPALAAEPLWAAAERQGVRAATFFWPISEADWHGVAPSYRRAPFDEELPESEKVRQILAWLDLPEAQRPGLVMSWWHGADGAGSLRADLLKRIHEADFLAGQKRSSEAADELAHADIENSEALYVHYYAALAYLQIGKADTAISELTRAVAAGYPRYLVRAAPEFETLKTDPQLVELLREPASPAQATDSKQGGGA